MGALEAVIAASANRLRRTNSPVITNPTIVDSAGKTLVGISRNRVTTYWADTTSATVGQLYTSTDDGVTFSAGWMATPFPNSVLAIAETPQGELLISTYSNGSRGKIMRTTGWDARTGPGNWGSEVVAASDFGNHFRPWNLNNQIGNGDLIFLCEYGKNSGPADKQARNAYLSRDDGRTFVTVFDLFSVQPGIAGAGYDVTATGYHNHCAIVDPWTGRVWISIGDNNDAIFYSDDLHQTQIILDAVTTSGSATVTTADTGRTTFTSADVGQLVMCANVPYGTTIAAVVDKRTVTLSANATATATGVKFGWGKSTWKKLHSGRGGHFQVTAMVATPNNVFAGSDGFPGGVHRIRKGAGQVVPIIENAIRVNTGTSTSTVCNYAYRPSTENAVTLISLAVAGSGAPTEPGLLLATLDEERWFTLWADTAKPGPGSGFLICVHTALGNVLGMITSNRTGSGTQIFRAPMPMFPNAQPWS